MFNPHFLPGIVAKRRRCLWMQGARSGDDIGVKTVVTPVLRRPRERNAADAGIFGVAADGW